ncbi:hypothetical protein JCM10207_000409 [Rhodosporidiobolus poonsookiae]
MRVLLAVAVLVIALSTAGALPISSKGKGNEGGAVQGRNSEEGAAPLGRRSILFRPTVADESLHRHQYNSTALPPQIVNTGDPQKNLWLDPSQVMPSLADDGQDDPAEGQEASATTTNNWINACMLTPNLPLTNGKQSNDSTCNPVPMGVIAASNRMPSCKFISPKNLDVIAPLTTFQVQLKVNNLETGWNTNPMENFFSAPQATTPDGVIIGHSHFVIEKLDHLRSFSLTDPQNFTFFGALNDGASQDAVLSGTVEGGLPEGYDRMASINTASNHQPLLVGVARHGALDDMIYFTVSSDPEFIYTDKLSDCPVDEKRR